MLRFLESVGRPAETRFYLDLFRARPREQFATIAIDGNVMRGAADAVALDLRFLAALGLFPSVVFGLLHPAAALSHAAKLGSALGAAGVAFTNFRVGEPDLGLRLADAARGGAVPILAYPAIEHATPAERFTDLGRLLLATGARKLIFLHRPGGLRQGGALVPIVSLSTDVPALLSSRDLSRKETVILTETRKLVDTLPGPPLVASVTSPLNLLRELFTVKGAGTMLRRGANIVRHDSWLGIDRGRVGEILAASFGRPPLASFFDREPLRVYLEESYRGVAILFASPLGAYLSKFAVTPEAQGEGIARELWDALAEDNPVVFWRARASNPINEWYTKLAEGLMRIPPWLVFWRGVTLASIPDAIRWAVAQPVDIPPAEAGARKL